MCLRTRVVPCEDLHIDLDVRAPCSLLLGPLARGASRMPHDVPGGRELLLARAGVAYVCTLMVHS